VKKSDATNAGSLRAIMLTPHDAADTNT